MTLLWQAASADSIRLAVQEVNAQVVTAVVGSGQWSLVHIVSLIDGEPAASILRRN